MLSEITLTVVKAETKVADDDKAVHQGDLPDGIVWEATGRLIAKCQQAVF